METLEQKIKELTPEQRREVQKLVNSLLGKQERKKGKKLRMTWAGALKEYRNQFTSLELQKKALEWRGH